MSKYRMPFSQYKQCQKMTKNEFSRWLETFADTMWNEGYQEAMKDVPDGSVVFDPNENVIINWDEDEFYNMLTSIKGVGDTLANKILDKIYEHYDKVTE